tara:strand:+ start:22 stop:468 length:447 start_codon:yes stop_codon:yes gene_type:complete
MIKKGMSNSHKYDIQVDWGDCDPAGIVFYPNFYRWMDKGFWLLFGSKGLTLGTLRDRYKTLGGPLVDTGATFIQPVQPGDILNVNSLVQHWGTKSFRIEYKFARQTLPVATGFEVRVWGALEKDGSITSSAIPQEVKGLFQDNQQDAV